MNSTQENKASMYFKVRTFLENHSADLAATPYVSSLATEFYDLLNKLLETDRKAIEVSTGFADVKQMKRDKLRDQALRIGRALGIHYAVTEQFVEIPRLITVKSNFDKMRDTDFYSNVHMVYDKAQFLETELADYGIISGEIAALKTNVDDFTQYLQLPKHVQSEKAMAGIQVDSIFAKIDQLLYEKLDLIMGMYETDPNGMYGLYQLCRGIDGTGSATAADFTGTIDPNTFLDVTTLGYLAGRSFEVENSTAGTALKFSVSTVPGVLEGTPMDLPGGETHTRMSKNLNVQGNYVVLHNPSPLPANYRIWVIE